MSPPRLVVISNRAPSVDNTRDSGGLVVALKDTFQERGRQRTGERGGQKHNRNHGLWIGGAPTMPEKPSPDLLIHERQDFDIALFELEPGLYADYYLGYSNSVLWPAFHGRVDLIDVQLRYSEAYRTVARRLAGMIVKVLRKDDIVWVHDYQMIPLAQEFRRLGVKNRIGFFLHIPLPDLQTFKAIPDWRDLSHWLSQYDLLGFQTRRDLAHMIDIFQRTMRGELRYNGNIDIAGREIALGCFPISIDVTDFARMAREAARKVKPAPLPRLIGVDRLDYSKGLPQRLAGYETFLETNPDYLGKVSLLQIAPPTRDNVEAYKLIRSELEEMSGRINGRFGTVDWTPIQYLHRALPRDKLAVLFRYSRAGMVTPLFDGMNLVAKEYVAAQDPDNPGVLVLSQFAGAAEDMSDALIVNPHDPHELAQAIRRALEMPEGERRERYQSLFKYLAANDVARWSANFLKHLETQGASAPSMHEGLPTTGISTPHGHGHGV